MKLILWGAVIFGLYTAWCWMPAYMTPSQLESGIENILSHLDHTSPDSAIVDRSWKAADSKDIYVPRGEIRLSREQRPGERVVNVDFEIPVTVSWLGSDKKLTRPVHVTHVFEVNEAAESQRLADIEEREARDREQNRIAMRHMNDYKDRVRRECAKGNEHFYTSSVQVTFSDGQQQMVDCGVVKSHW